MWVLFRKWRRHKHVKGMVCIWWGDHWNNTFNTNAGEQLVFPSQHKDSFHTKIGVKWKCVVDLYVHETRSCWSHLRWLTYQQCSSCKFALGEVHFRMLCHEPATWDSNACNYCVQGWSSTWRETRTNWQSWQIWPKLASRLKHSIPSSSLIKSRENLPSLGI